MKQKSREKSCKTNKNFYSDCVLSSKMAAIINAKKNVWSIEQRRRTLGHSNLIRKTVSSVRSLMLNRTAITPVPRFQAGLEPGESATSAVVDFPKDPKPVEGALFPMASQSMAASIHNETELQINALRSRVRIDVLGDRPRATERRMLHAKDITINELVEDIAVNLRLTQDKPLLANEDLLLVSMAPRDSYLSVPRDRNSVKNSEPTQEEKLPQFFAENFMLAMRSNVTNKDIESSILVNIDDLCRLNKADFPDKEIFNITKQARKRFNTNILAHLAANMKQQKVGTPKTMFKRQPDNDEKVSF